MIRVLFVDDHEMVRIGVSSYLTAQPDIEVVAEADDGSAAIDLALQHKPDIILMDLVMKEMDGIEATRRIIEKWPEAKIIIVTSFLDDDKVYPALEAGATSYMLKTSKASEIADAVRSTYQGQTVLEPEVTGKMMLKMRGKNMALPHEELTNRRWRSCCSWPNVKPIRDCG
ncbi:two-component response regulator [Bacillus sp. SG-1]|nr:two-component response regulator [Bacillus sp. SG-1]